ncbi:DUF4389 domain-containing protein [Psychromonas ossibalaenae]|uniref:DUF4389 domain-containing protein n=1 Tax=Psychromonas ossibalaenae TaxID=444922 RepID=UPI000381CF7F|nr:DUF4389 domain-containing protein [Psychromonas ossibalaenae]
MSEQQEKSYKNKSVWLRGLFMLMFVFLMGVAKFVTLVVVVLQFLAVLLTGETNENLLQFGKSLSVYQYQIVLYLTYNSELRPFPAADWPQE